MATIEFTQNYSDLSTDQGFQFKFFCDRCGNGYMSSFQSNPLGMAGGLLRAAGGLFGGILGNAGNSAYDIQRAVGGPQHDAALKAAVDEIKPHFHQCKRCGTWVCGEVCWNADRSLCKQCAPILQEELASAQADGRARSGVHARAGSRSDPRRRRERDGVGDADVRGVRRGRRRRQVLRRVRRAAGQAALREMPRRAGSEREVLPGVRHAHWDLTGLTGDWAAPTRCVPSEHAIRAA